MAYFSLSRVCLGSQTPVEDCSLFGGGANIDIFSKGFLHPVIK
jgi:hypothetical protein